jgi:two-component system response regulator NreC
MAPHLQLVPELADACAGSADRSVITVVLADDHALMRRSLRLILEGDEAIAVVAEADDLAGAGRHLHRLHPRVLVLDLNLPDGSALAAIGSLRRAEPQTQIVVVTMEDNPGFARRALAAGASGFVLKDHAEEELPGAVRTAAGRSPPS